MRGFTIFDPDISQARFTVQKSRGIALKTPMCHFLKNNTEKTITYNTEEICAL